MKLPQLTVTRFIAALGIVVLHYLAPTLAKLSPALGGALHYITSFVSYFFLLSGFILVVSSAGKHARPTDRQFYLNRFARIYPLYLFAFVLTAVVVATVGDRPFLYVAGSFAKPALTSVLLVQAWVPDYAYYLNYPSWSLSVEALFYALFPFLFRALSAVPTRGLVGVAAGSWLDNQLLHGFVKSAGATAPFANAFPAFHLATFVVGVCLGILFVRHRDAVRQYRRHIGVGLLVATLASGYLIGSHSELVRDFETGLFGPVFALIILYLCSRENRTVRLFSRPAAVYLGEISYGVYMLQAPVATFVRYVNKTYLHLNTVVAFGLLLVVLLLVSALCYECIEKPGQRWLRRLSTPRTAQSVEVTVAAGQVAH